MGLRVIIDNNIALGVLHPRIGPGGGVDTIVYKGAVGRSHFQGSHSVFKSAQSHVAHLLRIGLRQGGKAQLLGHEFIRIVGAVHQICPHGAGIQGLHNGLAHAGQTAVNPGDVSGPGAAVKVNGIVVNDGGRRNGAIVQCRGISADRLGRRAAGPHLRSPVPGPVRSLYARAAHHGYHITGIRIHHRHGDLQGLVVGVGLLLILRGLKLLLGDLLVRQVLGGVNLVAAAVHHTNGPLIGADDLALAVGLAVLQVIDLHEFPRHILDHLVGEIRVVGLCHLFAGLLLDGRCHIALHLLAKAVIAVGKDHLLVAGGLIVLLLLDHALLIHILQHQQLAAAVVLQGPIADERIIAGGIVGNGDEAGALRHGQVLSILAEIHPGRRLRTVAGLAEIHRIEIGVENHVLVVLLFQLQRPVDLRHLAFDGGLVVAGDVFDKLLGDGRPALYAAAGDGAEHSPGGALPIHALVLVKALVLDGHRRIPQALRDLVACKEDAVLTIIQGLIQLVFPRVGILGVHLGGQGQVIGGQIHLHLVLHSAVNVHGEQNGEKNYRQQQHRKDGPHNEPRLAPPGLYLPGGSLGMTLSLDLVQLILSGFFYFFGALLQLVSQAMFASLVLAHNGAPSFLSEFLCILLNSNHFNTIHQQGQTMVKIHYKFYFTMAVNLE